jgi:hypothetical protein
MQCNVAERTFSLKVSALFKRIFACVDCIVQDIVWHVDRHLDFRSPHHTPVRHLLTHALKLLLLLPSWWSSNGLALHPRGFMCGVLGNGGLYGDFPHPAPFTALQQASLQPPQQLPFINLTL